MCPGLILLEGEPLPYRGGKDWPVKKKSDIGGGAFQRGGKKTPKRNEGEAGIL